MTRFELRWVAAIFEAFAPISGPGLAPRAGEVDWVSSFVRMRAAGTALASFGVRLGLWIAALSPLWMCGRWSTMAGLGVDERAQLLGRLLEHRVFAVRELTMLLKIAACFALLGTPSVRERAGWDVETKRSLYVVREGE